MKRYVLIILIGLAFLFGGPQLLLCQEGRGNAVPADMLHKDLQSLDIKDYFVNFDAEEAGFVKTLVGHMVVRHGDSGEAYFAVPGDKLFKQDIIFTLEKSRCRLKFLDDNVVTLGEKTMIAIKEFVSDLKLKEKKSVYKLTRGKAMFYALKLFRYKKASMSVETPTAVAGVRGTKFGVEVKELQDKSAALRRPLYLADASETGWVRLAQSTEGYISATVVYNFDGTVTVTSTETGESVTLLPGQMVDMSVAGPGNVVFIAPDVWQQFLDDTSSNGGDGGDDGDGGGDGGDGGNGGDGDGGDDGGDGTGGTGSDTTDVTQTQTTQAAVVATDPVNDPKTNATGTQVGYFAGMLTNQSGSSLEEVFASMTRQDFGGDNIWARGSKDTSSDYLRVGPGYTLDNPYAKWAMFDSGSKNSGDLGDTHEISHGELGHISGGANDDWLLEWGYWTMPAKVTVDSVDYLVDNRGYYIFGDDTASMPSVGAATYSGDAWGTYWTSGGGTNMTGGFSCSVNFATALISNFDLSVLSSNESTSASITDATGSFSGGSYFQITGGTWNLNGTTPDDKMCYGSFYGSAADYIGGAWSMYYTASNIGATGIFKGDRQDPVNQYGYFTGMLTYDCCGDTYWDATFISTTMQTSGFGSAQAQEADNTTDYYVQAENGKITYWKAASAPPAVTWTRTTESTDIIQVQDGVSPYMEWGHWTQPTAMTVSSTDYYFDREGYYVWGDYTTDMPQSGSYIYSGLAYGTMAVGYGGESMSGDFSTNVNFTSGTLSNFDLTATGSSYKAQITNANGTISSSQFALDGTGTWEFESIVPNGGAVTADSKSAYGSFYGPNAAAMGGVWQMGYGGSYNAAGSFVSTSKTAQ